MKAFLSVLEDSPMVLKPAISATSDTPEFSVSDVVTRIREALFSLPDTRRQQQWGPQIAAWDTTMLGNRK